MRKRPTWTPGPELAQLAERDPDNRPVTCEPCQCIAWYTARYGISYEAMRQLGTSTHDLGDRGCAYAADHEPPDWYHSGYDVAR
jgi:hypothetical protein